MAVRAWETVRKRTLSTAGVFLTKHRISEFSALPLWGPAARTIQRSRFRRWPGAPASIWRRTGKRSRDEPLFLTRTPPVRPDFNCQRQTRQAAEKPIRNAECAVER